MNYVKPSIDKPTNLVVELETALNKLTVNKSF